MKKPDTRSEREILLDTESLVKRACLAILLYQFVAFIIIMSYITERTEWMN